MSKVERKKYYRELLRYEHQRQRQIIPDWWVKEAMKTLNRPSYNEALGAWLDGLVKFLKDGKKE